VQVDLSSSSAARINEQTHPKILVLSWNSSCWWRPTCERENESMDRNSQIARRLLLPGGPTKLALRKKLIDLLRSP